MKPLNQNLHFPIRVIVLALFCLATAPSAMAAHNWQLGHHNTNEHHASQPMTGASSLSLSHQKRSSIELLIVAENTADGEGAASDNSESGSDKEADMQAKDQNTIKECEGNLGVDCEKGIVRTAPPDLRDIPTPRPRPRPR